MSAGEYDSLIRTLIQALNEGNRAALDAKPTPGRVDWEANSPDDRTREDLNRWYAGLHSSLTDVLSALEEQLVAADELAERWTAYGTERGISSGAAPVGSGKAVSGMLLIRLVGGKAVQGWFIEDGSTLMREIGAITAPGETGKARAAGS